MRRAADGGSADAPQMLGSTFGPAFIQQFSVTGIVPDQLRGSGGKCYRTRFRRRIVAACRPQELVNFRIKHFSNVREYSRKIHRNRMEICGARRATVRDGLDQADRLGEVKQ
jgi:hypothetical protein